MTSFRLYLLFLDTFLLSFKTPNVETLLSRPESELLQRVFVSLTSVVFTGHIQLWTDSNWIMGIFVQLTVDKVHTLILFIPSSCPEFDFNFLSTWYTSHTHGVEPDAQRCPIRTKRLWKWRYHSIQTTENTQFDLFMLGQKTLDACKCSTSSSDWLFKQEVRGRGFAIFHLWFSFSFTVCKMSKAVIFKLF